MATRWKNRLLLTAWILLLTVGLSGVLLALTDGSNYIKKNYFHTDHFQYELNRFIDYVSILELNALSGEEASKLTAPADEEIAEYRREYGDFAARVQDVRNEYDSRIREAGDSNQQEAADYYAAERDRKIAKITKVFTDDDYVREILAETKKERLEAYERQLDRHRGEFAAARETFAFRLRNVQTGEVFANMASGEGTAAALNRDDMLYVRSYEALSTEGRPYDLHIEQPFPLPSAPQVYAGEIGVATSAPASSYVIRSYESFQQKKIIFFAYAIIGMLALLGSVRLYRRYPIAELVPIDRLQPAYDRIPPDVRALAFAVTGCLALGLLLTFGEVFRAAAPNRVIGGLADHLAFSVLLVSLVLVQYRLIRGQASRAVWRKALLYRGYRRLKEAWMIKSVAAQTFFLLSAVYAVGACLSFVAMDEEAIAAYIPLLLIVGTSVVWYVIKRVGYLNRIVRSSAEWASGNFEAELPVKGSSALASLAGSINALKYGVRASQKEQAKSERLKTELITNVSHDLRTPLTSIITYTELLKQPDVSEEDRNAYIEIIDRKSQRLKALIDDLFEASKMASGQIELAKERIDVVQLLQQALGEHNEAVKQSDVQFRVAMPEHPVFAMVDGPKLWRVFDNLIGNCLKYAMEHTRVYISMRELAGEAEIVFKNVTKYELSENVDELFERFKRGDESRHTDGSGLGLAIAKSIVDLHEGRLDIEVDGDLFKVTLKLSTA